MSGLQLLGNPISGAGAQWVIGASGMEVLVTPTGVGAADTTNVKLALEVATGRVRVGLGECKLLEGLPKPAHNSVTLEGMGNGTILSFPNDLGAGKYGIDWSKTNAQTNACHIANLQIKGPKTAVVGAEPVVEMDGVRLGPNGNVTNVVVIGFRAGISIGRDHNRLSSVKSTGNHWNLLWEDEPFTKSNHYIENCQLDGCGNASICIQGNNSIDGSAFVGTHVGFGPMGIRKMDGPKSGASGTAIASETRFQLYFEQCGNAAIQDDSSSTNGFDDVVFDGGGFSWDSTVGKTYSIGGVRNDFCIKVPSFKRTVIVMGLAPFLAGNHGVINCTVANSCGVDIDFGTNGTIPANLFGDGTLNSNSFRGVATVRQGGRASGIVGLANGAITSGDPLEWGGGNALVTKYGTGGANTNTGSPLGYAGIAAHTAVSGAPVVIMTEGVKSANCATTVAAGQLLYVDPATAVLTPVQGVGGTAAGTPNGFHVVAEAINANAAGVKGVKLRGPMRDPGFTAPTLVTALPGAGSAYLGQMLTLAKSGATPDTTYICGRNGAGVYSWQSIASSAAGIAVTLESARAPAKSAETMSRVDFLPVNQAVLNSKQVYVCGITIIPAGKQPEYIILRASTTALVAGVHQFFGLTNMARETLATTVDDGATAWASGTTKKLKVSGEWVAPVDTPVYVVVLVEATTPPSLSGAAGAANLNELEPILCGQSGSSGKSAIPATIGPITVSTAQIYACVTWA